VGRDDHARARIRQALEDRLGEGGPLARIGPHPYFVQQHETAGPRPANDAGETRHVGREGREVLAHVLPVADLGDDILHQVDAGAGLARHVQTGADEEGGEPDGLHRDRLPARVRARDHEGGEVAPEQGVVCDALFGWDQGVAQAGQIDDPLLAHVGFMGVQPLG